MTGVIYARYSSDNQREESIEGQLRENKAFAEKNGITIIETYIDRALSAKSDNRPDFQKMIKDSGKGKIKIHTQEGQQMNIKLVKLEPKYKKQLFDMMSEWLAAEQHFSPYAIRKNDYRNFDHYLENLELKEEYDGHVPDSTFFCLDTDRDIFVGAVNIRHYLNDSLLYTGGHIGDGIRPSERRKGYATAMIGLALKECKKLGIKRVLMTCNKDNIGSAKSIINNGGVLENEVINEEGVPEQRYWIDLEK